MFIASKSSEMSIVFIGIENEMKYLYSRVCPTRGEECPVVGTHN